MWLAPTIPAQRRAGGLQSLQRQRLEQTSLKESSKIIKQTSRDCTKRFFHIVFTFIRTFVLGNKIVDVKPFKRQKYKNPLQPIVNSMLPLKPTPVEVPKPPVPMATPLPPNVLVGMTQKPKVSANILASVSDF
jgi:hypothetical protein